MSDPSGSDPTGSRDSAREAAKNIADQISPLLRRARVKGFDFLAYLLAMALKESRRLSEEVRGDGLASGRIEGLELQGLNGLASGWRLAAMAMPKTPLLTTDCVICDQDGRVLLIRRKNEPFKGAYALPGGFVDIGETVEAACRREVLEETGLAVGELRLVGVYSDPHRDPRGHTVSIVYLTRLPRGAKPQGGV